MAARIAIIVGAGASRELGLPTGAELARGIANTRHINLIDQRSPHFSDDFQHAISIMEGSNWQSYLDALAFVRENMPFAPSVDNFVDTHKADECVVKVAKFLIADCILEGEQTSALAEKGGKMVDESAVSQSWLGELFRILAAERSYRDFLSALSRIDFVVFNYDRSIEEFFVQLSRKYFRSSSERDAEVLNALSIMHVYGVAGAYSSVRGGVPGGYGYHNITAAVAASGSLRTFTEEVDSASSARISCAIADAGMLVFVGFGFLDLNMRLLEPHDRPSAEFIIATSFGLSADASDLIGRDLFSRTRKESVVANLADIVRLEPLTAAQLISNYSVRLKRFLR